MLDQDSYAKLRKSYRYTVAVLVELVLGLKGVTDTLPNTEEGGRLSIEIAELVVKATAGYVQAESNLAEGKGDMVQW